MPTVKRVCFVCTGNIVRSPLAEYLFRYYARQAGVEAKYEVDSAGTDSYHVGEKPDARMLKVAARFGHQYEHRARQFLRSDFNRYDVILVMDTDNRADLMYLALYPEQQEKIHMLREFDPQGGSHLSVPDPWYGGSEGFREVFDVVDRSVQGLLAHLENDAIPPAAG